MYKIYIIGGLVEFTIVGIPTCIYLLLSIISG